MSAVVAEEVLSSVAGRWRRIDPMLPAPEPPADRVCGAELVVPPASGRAAAVGWCRHHQAEPEAEELTWRAAAQFWLTAYVAGDAAEPGIGTALDELLALWRAHVAAEPAQGGQDSQVAVRWPSRDVAGVRALLRHGLQPLGVLAARPAGRVMPNALLPGGPRIRPAGLGDVDVVTALSMEVVRFDQHFGSVRERPHTERVERQAVGQTLARPEPWTWLAERDGQVVGLLVAEPPGQAGWIASAVSKRPVAYLATMAVRPQHRGSGVGTALVARLHREVDASGVAVTLLHHAQLNPLSAPFWSRMGYRPLWTSWEMRPARAFLPVGPAPVQHVNRQRARLTVTR
jgi:GNAT superfamily N-acetyltransferase